LGVPALTWETLRELAGFRSGSGCAVSLFLGLDPSTAPTAADAETRLRALLSHAEKEPAGRERGHQQKAALRADVERIREWWKSEFRRDGLRGLALYASSADGLWRTLPLAEHVPDGVSVGSELALVPLVPLVGRDNGALVAFVGRERGLVFRLTGGRLEEVVDESEEQPGQHDQGGWAQARYQRHIDKLVADHLRNIGSELDRRVRRARPELVLVAPEELRNELLAKLATETREAVVGWTEADAYATPTDLLEVVRPVLDDARATRERELVDRWRDELGRGGKATAGWSDTLATASDGTVEVLLVDPSADRTANRCPECGRAYAEPGPCPLDGSELEPRSGVDLAAHLVLGSGGTVLAAGGNELGAHEGIGALLRF